MAPGASVSVRGWRPAGSGGKRLFTVAVPALPGRLPASLRGDSVGIGRSWRAGGAGPGPEALWEGRVLTLLDSPARCRWGLWGLQAGLAPQAEVRGKTEEGGLLLQKKHMLFPTVFPVCEGKRGFIPASPNGGSPPSLPPALCGPAAVATST